MIFIKAFSHYCANNTLAFTSLFRVAFRKMRKKRLFLDEKCPFWTSHFIGIVATAAFSGRVKKEHSLFAKKGQNWVA
ncbi:MAG TPA: hypothetical protein PKV29_07685 [Trichococcus flocculiformis]|nr:hypothetical protein [Trichococcus flocculiformis]